MQNTQELLAVKTVYEAISLIYLQFGDPLYDRDPRLVQWLELLQEYCMSKGDNLITVQGAMQCNRIR